MPPVADAAIGLGAGPALFESAGNSVIPLFIPSGTPPGIYLPRIDGTPSVYLKPVWVESSQPAPEEPTHGTFADKALKLHDVRVAHPRPNRLDIQLDWSGARPVAANYGLSLRLTDPAGNQWLHQDGRPGYNTQPGHGFLPTSLWPLDRLIQDHHRPAVRSGAPPGDDYVLTIDLYEVATWRSVGQVTTTVALTEVSKRPDAPVAARFGEALLLSRLDVPSSARQGERVAATAYWSVAKRPSRDYVVEYRLDGPDDRIVGTQQLAPGSTPETWPPGAWIAGRMALSLPPTAPPGDYAVSLTLKDPTDGQPIGSYTHPVPLHVQKQQRIWELPAMGETVRVRFGDMIELAGYDLIQKANKVELTLYWQALTTPDRHYMFFVHLADPETGEPASQVDTMPHQFNYPTGQWAPGEVVSDVVEISTRDVSPGRYVLTVGWYDPDTNRRLPAFDSEGARLSDDRLVLPRSITLP